MRSALGGMWNRRPYPRRNTWIPSKQLAISTTSIYRLSHIVTSVLHFNLSFRWDPLQLNLSGWVGQITTCVHQVSRPMWQLLVRKIVLQDFSHTVKALKLLSRGLSYSILKAHTLSSQNSSLVIIQGLLRFKFHLEQMTSVMLFVPFVFISTLQSTHFIRLLYSDCI